MSVFLDSLNDEFESLRSHILNAIIFTSIEKVYFHIKAEEQWKLLIVGKHGDGFNEDRYVLNGTRISEVHHW